MGFMWDARGYDGNATFQRGLAAELLRKIRLRGDERVLDIGCGDGKNTAKMAQLVPEGSVLGIDSSRDMIAHASMTYPPYRFHNLRFDVMDVLEMDYKAEFDVIFSNAALHWVKDHRRMLKKVSAGLKPRGRILLQMGGEGNADSFFEALNAVSASDRWRGYFKGLELPFGFYGPNEYGPWLIEAGLKPLRVELINRDNIQEWPDGFKGWVRTTWLPFTQRVPKHLMEGFIDEASKEYIRCHPLGEDGKAHVMMKRLEVEAEKVNPDSATHD